MNLPDIILSNLKSPSKRFALSALLALGCAERVGGMEDDETGEAQELSTQFSIDPHVNPCHVVGHVDGVVHVECQKTPDPEDQFPNGIVFRFLVEGVLGEDDLQNLPESNFCTIQNENSTITNLRDPKIDIQGDAFSTFEDTHAAVKYFPGEQNVTGTFEVVCGKTTLPVEVTCN